MKRTLQHLLVMAGLLLASSEVFAQEWEERVVNGDFEGSDFSSFAIKPKNEDIRNLEANDIVVDDENANNHYVKIVPTNKQDALFYIKIGDALSEGDRIIVSMHAKVKNSDVGRICFQAHGEADEYKGSLMEKSISKLWGFFNYEGVVSADQNGCKTIAICLNTRGAAKNELYLDDIKVMVMRDTPIKFANTKVKEICVKNWDTNGDGELSTGEASVVKVREGFDPQFGNYFFYYKEDITSFDELQYFIGLDKIGGFGDCVNLTSIVIPNSVRIINSRAFERCISLTSIDIPNSVEYIGSYSFDGCSSLTSIELPNSLRGIGRIIEGNSEEVGERTFRGCESLTSIVIPSQVKTLDSNLFEGCSSLTSLTIPKSVKQIFGNPVPGCSSLTSLNVEEGNTVYDSRDNCNAIINTSSNELLAGCKNTVIPNSVTSIGGSAFSGCSGLTSISIPNSITSIGGSAFSGCSGLTSISIPNSITSIGGGAFSGCSSLTSITIPNSVTSIEDRVFSNCNSLATIEVESNNTVYDSRDNCNAIIKTSENELIAGCNNTIIPNSVTSIGDDAFYGCSGLSSITIPNSVRSIGNHTFGNCKLLNSITFKGSTHPGFGEDVFMYVNKSIPIYVPSKSIEAYRNALEGFGMSNIQAITLSLKDNEAYTENSQIEEVDVTYTRNFTNTKWQALYLPFSLKYEDWKDDFEIAYISAIRQRDTNDDGNMNETALEVIKMNSGSTVPNTPYLIRAKETGEKTLSVENTTVYPAENNSVDCTTTTTRYTFTGTYKSFSLLEIYKNSYYVVNDNKLNRATSTFSIKPYYWYMTIKSRNSSYATYNPAKEITISVLGEEEATGIRQLRITNDELPIYDMNGRVVSEKTLKPGVYVKNGRKFVVK